MGARGSHLARTQAAGIADELAGLGHETSLAIIQTAGDRSSATSFSAIGPQGVFVREIERSLLKGEVDIAVHSCKDLPTHSPAELTVAAVPARLDPADVLVMRKEAAAEPVGGLPIVSRAKVGTASARRQAWIRHLRPDITVVPIRGNVPTRIGRLQDGLDGVVLAAAGLARLRSSPLDGVSDPVTGQLAVHRLSPEVFVPAPAQGALAVQCRRADERIRAVLKALDHEATRQWIHAERGLLARVQGGCDAAFGAYSCADAADSAAASSPNGFRLVAWLEREGDVLKARGRGPDPDALMESVWRKLERQWTG